MPMLLQAHRKFTKMQSGISYTNNHWWKAFFFGVFLTVSGLGEFEAKSSVYIERQFEHADLTLQQFVVPVTASGDV